MWESNQRCKRFSISLPLELPQVSKKVRLRPPRTKSLEMLNSYFTSRTHHQTYCITTSSKKGTRTCILNKCWILCARKCKTPILAGEGRGWDHLRPLTLRNASLLWARQVSWSYNQWLPVSFQIPKKKSHCLISKGSPCPVCVIFEKASSPLWTSVFLSLSLDLGTLDASL